MRGLRWGYCGSFASTLGIDVAGHVEHVHPAVVVEIGQPRAPLHEAVLHAETGLHRHVLEQPAAAVPIQRGNVVGKVRLEDVERAIGVDVAERHAHPGLRRPQLVVGRAARQRDVGEGAVVVVAVEDGGGRIGGDVDVDPAVAVEVGGRGRHGIAPRDP